MKKKYALVGLVVLFWGTVPPLTKALLGDMSNTVFLSLSSLAAAIFLLLISICTGKIHILRRYQWKDWLKLVALGILGLFLFFCLYYYGLSVLPAQDACILNYMWPMMATVSSFFILKEKFSWRKVIAFLVSFTGVAIITLKNTSGGVSERSILGIVACLLAATCYGIFTAWNKKENYEQITSMMIYFFVATVGGGILLLMDGGSLKLDAVQTIGIMYMGIFPNGLAYALWGWILMDADTAKITNMAYASPVIAIILSAIFLKEGISIYSVVGIAFVLGGIFIQLGTDTEPEKSLEIRKS